MADTEAFIPVQGTRQNLETTKFTNNDGDLVHREAVYIGSPTDYDAQVGVTRRSDGSYGLNTEGEFADSANIDGNSRLRVANPVNVFLNKNIHSKNDNLWEEPIVGAIIVYSGLVGGPFQVGETITGGTSGTVGTVTAVDGGALTITYTVNHNDFVVGETITGSVSGATATVDSFNTGSHIYHERDTSSAILQVGQSNGDSAIRQSHRYIPYRPGKNQHITQTFYFGAAVADVARRVGYYDDENGLFLEQNGTTDIAVVRRTKTTGVSSDHRTVQADWVNDTLDGAGGDGNPSGITLDLSKVQYLIIDFQWQGVGRIRWGFELEGKILYFHEEKFTNTDTDPFMSTPSLPTRYEIMNTAATSSTNDMREICTSVVSEGGERLTGLGFAESNDITLRTVGTTLAPILAVRLANSVDGGPNRKTLEFVEGGVFTVGNNSAHYHVERMHDPSGITATWAAVGGDSVAEISTDITAITGNPRNVIKEGYASGGGGARSAGQKDIGTSLEDQHRIITQNFDSTNSEVLVVFAQAFSGTIDVVATLEWTEYE